MISENNTYFVKHKPKTFSFTGNNLSTNDEDLADGVTADQPATDRGQEALDPNAEDDQHLRWSSNRPAPRAADGQRPRRVSKRPVHLDDYDINNLL